MSVVKIVETIKSIHPEHIVLVKIGEFYHVYGRDSYILSYLFKYKLKKVEDKTSSCGFPSSGINKILANLEQNEISYLILDRRNNYEVDEKYDSKKNSYKKNFDKAYDYVRLKNRIDTIYDYMIDNIFKQDFQRVIVEVENILYERRKI